MTKPDSTAVMSRRHTVVEDAPLFNAMNGGGLVLRPSGHTSVMAHRQATPPDDLDYFPTPPWAARAGAELIKSLDPDARSCWEPACGGGHMAHGLRDYFETVRASDVFDYGQGEVLDFLGQDADGPDQVDWVITNPPFKVGEAFVRAAWPRARRGVAMLLRLVFLEGGKRFRLYQDLPLTVCAPFSERVPMVKGRWDPDASSATAYAWFIWQKHRFGRPALSLIPPGSKARLTRPGDARAFGEMASAPLFGDAS